MDLRVHAERRVAGGVIQAAQWATLPGVPASALARLRPDAGDRLLAGYIAQARRLSMGLLGARRRGGTVCLAPPLGPAVLCLLPLACRQSAAGVDVELLVVGGLLAARGEPSGRLRLALVASGAAVEARIELSDYRPPLAGVPLLGPLYDRLQARVHAAHGARFLRWLARRWPRLLQVEASDMVDR